MRRSYKFRLYPNANQIRELEIMLETHRRLYNECLEYRKISWEVYGVGISFYEQRSWLKHQQHNKHPYYSRLNNGSANTTVERLDKSFRAFFRRVKAGEKPGYPRFKGRDQFNTFNFETYPSGLKLIDKKIRIQYIGQVRVKLHREIQGKIKTASINWEAGKWYVIFSCDLGEVSVTPSTDPPVGIDVGITSFLTTDEGEREPNPRYQKKELPELRRLQRSLSRKKKGGTNRRKARRRVAKLHARIKNLRRDHHYKTALKLVRRYGLIAVESLNIKGMLRNRRLARSIGDVAWGNFLIRLKHKAEEAGVKVIEVDPKGTSQLCCRCGNEVPKDLSVRWHDCPHCGLSIDRDQNAALNILSRGLRQARTELAGRNGGNSPHAPRKSIPTRTFKHLQKKRVDKSAKT